MSDERASDPEPAAGPGVEGAASADTGGITAADRVTVRRSPRYGRFLVIGLGVGAIAAFVGTNLFPIDEEVGFAALFGYLLLFALPIGAGIAGLVAVALDAIANRRAREYDAERTWVEAPDVPLEGDLEDPPAPSAP